MGTADMQFITDFYYGRDTEEHTRGWYPELELHTMLNSIDKIYEVREKGFLGAFYVMKLNEKIRNDWLIIKHDINDVNTSFMFNGFLQENPELEDKVETIYSDIIEAFNININPLRKGMSM